MRYRGNLEVTGMSSYRERPDEDAFIPAIAQLGNWTLLGFDSLIFLQCAGSEGGPLLISGYKKILPARVDVWHSFRVQGFLRSARREPGNQHPLRTGCLRLPAASRPGQASDLAIRRALHDGAITELCLVLSLCEQSSELLLCGYFVLSTCYSVMKQLILTLNCAKCTNARYKPIYGVFCAWSHGTALLS